MYRALLWFALIVPVLSAYEKILNDFYNVVKVTDLRTNLLSLEESDVNYECLSHAIEYIKALGENVTWANLMFDSMEKIPYGILYGHSSFIGNYDECLSAKAEEFKGKHCMLDFSFGPVRPESQSMLFGNFKISYGLCLPSTCYESDITEAIKRLNISSVVNITVDEGNCSTDDPVELLPENWLAIIILSCFAFVVLCSTVYELTHQKNAGKRHELYTSFSLHNNWKQLMKIYKGPGNIGCLHGIRTLTMCWVVLAHEYVTALMNPSLNRMIVGQYLMNKEKVLISNSFVSVDTFFLMSGLLVTLIFFRDISKKGSYDVPVAVIHRFIRITPAYAAMILIQSALFLKLGEGPLWNRIVRPGVDACKDHWWPGLLYIQNFVAPRSMCLGQSWYLSSDMQMFWLSPLLLYPMLVSPTIGFLVYILYLTAALTTDVIIGVIYNLGPQIFLSTTADQFIVEYVQTHTRLVPYIIGMGLAYIICGIKANKIRVNLSKTWIIIGWLASSALCLGSVYGISYFLDNGFYDKTAESVSYLALHRLGWSLGLSWIIFACFAGYGGIINQFLSWNGFQVLGKLSYCMFLVHFSVQMGKTGVMRTNGYLSDFEVVTRFFSTLVLSVLFSIPLYLFFEIPFCNIDKYTLRNVTIYPYPRRKIEKHEENANGNANVLEGAENKGYHEEPKF